MASTFPTLPQEMVNSITPYPAQTNLSNLSKTYKAIRIVTLEALFKKITMTWKGDSKEYPKEHKGHMLESPCINLLRTMIETPKLVTYISIVSLRAEGFRRHGSFLFGPSLPSPLKPQSETFLATLRETGMPKREDMEAGLKANSLDAIIALFLVKCPNLTTLTIAQDLLRHNHHIGGVLSHALSAQPTTKTTKLEHLKSLNLGADPETEKQHIGFYIEDLGSSLDMRLYLPFFHLPTLEEAEMNLPAEWNQNEEQDKSLAIMPGNAPSLKNCGYPKQVLHLWYYEKSWLLHRILYPWITTFGFPVRTTLMVLRSHPASN
ncbi:uncharacterized protein BDZ99DRAFT_311137 [Mytilinidion resinicola]|uniref:F-box domain-containing protein n=1 Tax=Mytilinidion resinicola TaxID=574789 RepID=A0A6A6YPE2_9PEZI|nr:uncharacterized protein BDZ99DRAFT_311137 [Mytilinidion resinicola]KAF2810419.1 hypothetical protein BDZ99DRAFT_311137 [Mytilinidion resinicola]